MTTDRAGSTEPEVDAAPGRADGGPAFWAVSEAELLDRLGAGREGLSIDAARERLGGLPVHSRRPMPRWRLGLRQVSNPIVMLLIGASVLSMLLGDPADATIILLITAASAILGYVQERGAVMAVHELMGAVRTLATVRRDGAETSVSLDDVVIGDILLLGAGDVIAADARVLDVDSLLVDESALTGESFPVEKSPGVVPSATSLAERSNAVWCGTHVVSGTCTAVVAAVGDSTEFGKIGVNLAGTHLPTAFELGLRRFGLLLMRTTALLVGGIFIANVVLHRPILEAFLFSLALAVGLTPQLLPTIVTVTLSQGARQLARRRVIVKRLDAIEDIGAVDILCTDKTGTLTTGDIMFDAAVDLEGRPSAEVHTLAYINATAQRGFGNPIDRALAATTPPTDPTHRRIAELPYDFTRRRLSVLVERAGSSMIITKGAVDAVLDVCDGADHDLAELRQRFAELSQTGLRVLAVASRAVDRAQADALTADDEQHLTFRGFLCFTDPPKPDAADAISELVALGVATKIITGDNRHAAAHAANAVGLDASGLATGAQIAKCNPVELEELVGEASVFAEIDPLQKETIVAALRRCGHRVGYLGDGINDAPSLRSADVGISVDGAVDIARHTASIVLLEKDLAVIGDGIRHGRRVFANTIKYVQVTISANFGNMISMAIAALFLPFLPLLPRQILLLNFLSDIPAMTIAADRVDPEAIERPHGWDITRLRRFMIVFGLISSAFDIATFYTLRVGFNAGAELFRTGWFIESTATELAVMLVLRTWRPAWRSRPAMSLITASAFIASITLALPYSPVAADLGLTRPTIAVLGTLGGITFGYIAVTEAAKRFARPPADPGSPEPVSTRSGGANGSAL